MICAGNFMNTGQERIRSITSSIKSLVDPKTIVLFGSHAHGVPDEESDIDLLVVDDSGRDKRTVSFEISRALFPRDYGLDLLVESSEDLERKMGLQFWRDAITSGAVLYERE
jgi:predicted nucleotidyltransferase